MIIITFLLTIQFNVPKPGLDSATCLDGLIAFLQLTKSSTKEADNHGLSRSYLMLPSHLYFGWPQG